MQKSADLVLENANIITCSTEQPRASALAASGGIILAVGERADIEYLKTTATLVIDCAGKTAIPGFIDAHCHYFSTLRKILSLDLGPDSVHSIRDICTAINRKTAHLPPGTWISGTDYNEFYLQEKRHPLARDLDTVSPQHPVILTHRSLHACVLNSLAMRLIGIDNETEEPAGGLIERDLESGQPNGLFYEMLPLVQQRIHSPLSREEYRWGLKELNRRFLKYGITSFTDATVTNSPAQFETFERLVKDGLIQSRASLMLGSAFLKDWLASGICGLSERPPALKIVISQATGEMQPPQSVLNNLVLEANRAGFQAAIHAVEKSSVEAAVIALEYARRNLPGVNRRNRVEHCSECSPDSISRLAGLGAIIVTQPPFLYFQGERYLAQTPADIQPILYPLGSWQAAGLLTAGSSDAPVVDFNPLIGIYSAVTRRARSGEVLQPGQNLSVNQALLMYTRHAALAGFEEKSRGSLETGKLADIVLLSENPLRCPPERIKDIRVEMTVIGGRILYEV